MESHDIYHFMTQSQLDALEKIAAPMLVAEGEAIFQEGDPDDAFYLIRNGQVAVTIEKSGKQEVAAVMGPGEVFGESVVFHPEPRTESAVCLTEVNGLRVIRDDFLDIVKSESDLLDRLYEVLKRRDNALRLKEQLVAATGIEPGNLNVSIKGDPSMRETAFTRERHQSMVDQILPELIPSIRYLLFETSVFRIFVGLNNGEIRLSSVIHPFIEEVHTAKKIVSQAYLRRHCPKMDYQDKCDLIKDVSKYIEKTAHFSALDTDWQKVLDVIEDDWSPIPRSDLESVVDQLVMMRNIPNFYLRNFILSIAQDAIRMQFNCDGTHIVSARQYHQFLEDNIILE